MSNIAALMDLLFPGTLGRELDKLTTTGLLLRIEQGNQVPPHACLPTWRPSARTWLPTAGCTQTVMPSTTAPRVRCSRLTC